MARVVVVGGGFGGLASAVRLAKLGHEVTLVERSPSLGGALTFESEDGFAWDAGPSYTLLPAVIRDLFRKSGRPVERELDLEPLPEIREHRFEDGSSVKLPGRLAGSPDRRAGRARQGARPAVGGPRGVVLRPVGDAAPRLPRGPLGPRAPPPRAGGAAGQPRGAPQTAEEGLQGRAAAADRRAPVRRRGARPAQRALLARRDGVRRAAVRCVGDPRRHGASRERPWRGAWRRAR